MTNVITLTAGDLSLSAEKARTGVWTATFRVRGEARWAYGGDVALHIAREDAISALETSRAPGYARAAVSGDVLTCSCAVSTARGSRVDFTDEYRLSEDGVALSRRMSVASAAAGDAGFFADTEMPLPQADAPEELAWFAPGYWYGKGEPFFRLNGLGEAGEAVDAYSAPVIMGYDERRARAVTLTDNSPGRRRTVAGDHSDAIPGALISEEFFLPGMGVCKTATGAACLYHAYPAYTHMDGKGTLYRLLPMRPGLSRDVRMGIRALDAPDFYHAMRAAWRAAWQTFAKLRVFVSPDDARRTLLQYVDASYTCDGDVHKYMKDADYNEASSGFLFRNIDLAHLMLEASDAFSRADWRERALAVVESQVRERRLYGRGKTFDLRASIEALHSLLKCYAWSVREGTPRPEWLVFVIAEAEELLPVQEYYSLPLLCALHRQTGDARYLSVAEEKGHAVWEESFRHMLFMHGITDCGPQTIDRESSLLALEGYLDVFEATRASVWLERAIFCADFLETMQIIQDIDLAPVGATGRESANRLGHYVVMAGAGNDLTPAGLSHITAGGACGDIYSAYAAPDYYRLYRYTGDAHYLDVSKALQQHPLQYIDMNNKSGGMKDSRHHTGAGFINEFFAVGICTGYVTGRGWAHGDNIGWCPYVLLSAYDRMRIQS